MSLREHPVHEIEKHLRELEEHLRVRCRTHTDLAVSKRPDELFAARHHVDEIRRLVKDIIPWERDAENEKRERDARREATDEQR